VTPRAYVDHDSRALVTEDHREKPSGSAPERVNSSYGTLRSPDLHQHLAGFRTLQVQRHTSSGFPAAYAIAAFVFMRASFSVHTVSVHAAHGGVRAVYALAERINTGARPVAAAGAGVPIRNSRNAVVSKAMLAW